MYLHASGCPCDRLAEFCGVVVFGCRPQACILLRLAAGHNPVFTYVWLQDANLYSLMCGCRPQACIHLCTASIIHAQHVTISAMLCMSQMILLMCTKNERSQMSAPPCIPSRPGQGKLYLYLFFTLTVILQFVNN